MEDDHKRIRRQRAIRVMITEILMFLSVVLLVIFLTLIVLGYNFNIKKLGTEEVIERAGLIQVTSIPSGATVSLDGEEGDLFSRTTFSKTLGVGKHTVSLTRDGYDTWTGEVEIREGLLFRLSYPRLFLEKRTREEILAIEDGTSEAKFYKGGRYLSLDGKFLDLNETKPSFKEVRASDLEDEDEAKIARRLEKIKGKFSNGVGLTLGEYLGEEYVVTAEKGVLIGEEMILREGVTERGIEESEGERVETEEGERLEGAKNFIKFYRDEDLINGKKKAFFETEVEFEVREVEVRGKGELVVVRGERDGKELEMIYDFETEKLETREVEGERWLDEFLKYKISESGIEVFDFNGKNRREIVSVEGEREGEEVEKEEGIEAEEVETAATEIIPELGVKISANNRYLYYFILEAGEEKLVREKIN